MTIRTAHDFQQPERTEPSELSSKMQYRSFALMALWMAVIVMVIGFAFLGERVESFFDEKSFVWMALPTVT